MNIIVCKNLTRTFGAGESAVHALNDVSFEIKKGAFTVILGRSGSGKSTLLNQFCGLDKPTSGELVVDGVNISKLNGNKMADYRGSIGIIFQSYNLLPNLNAVENILMGSWAASTKRGKQNAGELMEFLGIKHREKTNIKTLSGGEKQRVAIARSLINDPEVIFCDEPTGALDSENEKRVMEILLKLNKEGKTIVMVTHNPDFVQYASQIIKMQDGKIIENTIK